MPLGILIGHRKEHTQPIGYLMGNEMSKRTKYLVTAGDHTARFSTYSDAIFFAREASRWDGPVGSTNLVEVRDASGLIAQFSDAKFTPEFEHLNV